jgi:hypothetical protein
MALSMLSAPGRPVSCPKCGARDIQVTKRWEPDGTQYYVQCPSPAAGGPDHTSTVEVRAWS